MTGGFAHVPVLLAETLTALAPRAGGAYCDCTLGRGGHAEAILERSAPDGRLVGIDRDPVAIEASRVRLGRFGARVTLLHGAFGAIREHLAMAGVPSVDGLVADLGVSSPQLDEAERGFSFQREGPLDMRMDPTCGPTAKELVASLSENELADVLYTLGDERKSRPIARAIKRREAEGALETTRDLRDAIVSAVGRGRPGSIDPATRSFQALRIAVNREDGELRDLLAALPDVLAPGGVAAIIAFHSHEDRAVKRAFRGSDVLVPLTKKPVIASGEEAARNPRARSAKLRAARRLGPGERRGGAARDVGGVDGVEDERGADEPEVDA